MKNHSLLWPASLFLTIGLQTMNGLNTRKETFLNQRQHAVIHQGLLWPTSLFLTIGLETINGQNAGKGTHLNQRLHAIIYQGLLWPTSLFLTIGLETSNGHRILGKEHTSIKLRQHVRCCSKLVFLIKIFSLIRSTNEFFNLPIRGEDKSFEWLNAHDCLRQSNRVHHIWNLLAFLVQQCLESSKNDN